MDYNEFEEAILDIFFNRLESTDESSAWKFKVVQVSEGSERPVRTVVLQGEVPCLCGLWCQSAGFGLRLQARRRNRRETAVRAPLAEAAIATSTSAASSPQVDAGMPAVCSTPCCSCNFLAFC